MGNLAIQSGTEIQGRMLQPSRLGMSSANVQETQRRTRLRSLRGTRAVRLDAITASTAASRPMRVYRSVRTMKPLYHTSAWIRKVFLVCDPQSSGRVRANRQRFA